MATNYDKLYGEKRDALGEPTPVFVKFFERLEKKHARILDVGCGQGRDALFIARQGYNVVGVDISPNGIRDLVAAATKENLDVQGVVADITAYEPSDKFDVVLIDRTLHMLGRKARLSVLEKLLGHVEKGGWILIADEASNMSGFKDVIASHHIEWEFELSKGGYLFTRRP